MPKTYPILSSMPIDDGVKLELQVESVLDGWGGRMMARSPGGLFWVFVKRRTRIYVCSAGKAHRDYWRAMGAVPKGRDPLVACEHEVATRWRSADGSSAKGPGTS